jgi:hypothetical protein
MIADALYRRYKETGKIAEIPEIVAMGEEEFIKLYLMTWDGLPEQEQRGWLKEMAKMYFGVYKVAEGK